MTDRSISPEIRRSENFARLEYRERDLYQGLIERLVDDQGRAKADAAIVRSEVWPYDDITLKEIEESLQVLAGGEEPFILLYTVNRKRYLQIINWWKWQRKNLAYAHRSLYPAPENWMDRVRINTKGNRMDVENWDLPGGFESVSTGPSAAGEWVQAQVEDEVPSQVLTQVGTKGHTKADTQVDINTDADTSTLGIGQDTSGLTTLPGTDQKNDLKTAQNLWDYATGELRREGISRTDFEQYVRPLTVVGMESGILHVRAINRYTVEYVTRRQIKKVLEDKIRAAYNLSEFQIELQVQL